MKSQKTQQERRRVVCLWIPARGGSKRIPRKNLAELDTDPLVVWTVRDAVAAADTLTKKHDLNVFVVVDTDDEEILRAAQDWSLAHDHHLYVYSRAYYLAEDAARTSDCVMDFIYHSVRGIDRELWPQDIMVALQPTSPFRGSESIVEVVEMLLDGRAVSVVSGTELEHPVEWTSPIEGGTKHCFIQEDGIAIHQMQTAPKWVWPDGDPWTSKAHQRQGTETRIRLNGAIFAAAVMFLLRHQCFHQDRIEPWDGEAVYLMSKIQSMDIDDEDDLEICRAIAARRNMLIRLDDACQGIE